jgi:hypothetical protein
MRRSIFSIFFFTLFQTFITTASAKEIDLSNGKTPPCPRILSRATSFSITTNVSADINETELSVYFDSPVGTATITVYDVNNQIVDQQTVDTNSTSEAVLPIDVLDSGDYTVEISYGTTTLVGSFIIE